MNTSGTQAASSASQLRPGHAHALLCVALPEDAVLLVAAASERGQQVAGLEAVHKGHCGGQWVVCHAQPRSAPARPQRRRQPTGMVSPAGAQTVAVHSRCLSAHSTRASSFVFSVGSDIPPSEEQARSLIIVCQRYHELDQTPHLRACAWAARRLGGMLGFWGQQGGSPSNCVPSASNAYQELSAPLAGLGPPPVLSNHRRESWLELEAANPHQRPCDRTFGRSMST